MDDFDNDGYLDLVFSDNNGGGTFNEVARDLHVEKPIWSFPVWFLDYDNDGWLDLYVSVFIVSVTEVIGSYLSPPGRMETQKLYKNVKGRRFDDVTREVGLDRVVMTMGANFGDVNNNGFLDIYLGTGSPSYASLVPNILYLTRIDTVEVWWPTSNTRQVFHNVNPNQYIEIHEFAKEYLKLDRQPVRVLP